MEHMGIVRSIDELGRVVIPKEIRRTLRIREGDPLELYTDSKKGTVTIKKYHPEKIFNFHDEELREIVIALTKRIGEIDRNISFFELREEVVNKCRQQKSICESILNRIDEITKEEAE